MAKLHREPLASTIGTNLAVAAIARLLYENDSDTISRTIKHRNECEALSDAIAYQAACLIEDALLQLDLPAAPLMDDLLGSVHAEVYGLVKSGLDLPPDED